MSNKVKILFGIESVGGGAFKHLVYLITHLPKDKFDITLILSDPRGENIDNVLKMLSNNNVTLIHHSMTRKFNIIKDFKSFIYIFKILDEGNYEIVHAHSTKAGLIFRLAAWKKKVKKVYFTPHCFYFQSKKGAMKYFLIILEKILSKITSKLILSDIEYKLAIKYKISDNSKLELINNAICFDEYRLEHKIENVKKNFGINKSDFIVGSIGRLVKQKDWKTYIYSANEVLKVYPNITFLIVGEGNQKNDLAGLIKKLNITSKVKLLGYVEDIYKIYNIMDVFVNTSLWEGLPYVFLEAMMYKKPIITTYGLNYSEAIDRENAIVCPEKDYVHIADKIISLIQDKSKIILMGESGNKRLFKKFSFDLFILKHSELYCKY